MTKPAEAVASIWPSGVEKMQPVRKFYPFFLLHCKRKPCLSETDLEFVATVATGGRVKVLSAV